MYGGSGLDYGLLALAAALLLVLWRRQGWLHPVTIFAALWTLIMGVRLTAPMMQANMTSTAALIVGAGVLAVCAPALLGHRAREPETVQLGERAVALARLVGLTAIVGGAVGVGLFLFRSQISDYYGGASVGQLTATAIRAAQNAGRGDASPLAVLFSLSPLLGALGIYGGLRFSRLWYLVTAVALAATLQSPARITTLGLVATCAAFYAYARPAIRHDPRAPIATAVLSRKTLLVRLGLVAAAALGYFVVTSSILGKASLAEQTVPGWSWPSWLLSPVMYLVGGVAGLTADTQLPAGFNDPFDGSGQSVYLLVRAVGQHPNSLAHYTPAPFPTNVYTAFGNQYFDFGVAGVVVLSLVLGLLAHFAFRRHAARLEWAWVAAVLVNVLVTSGMAYRLFSLDIDALLVSGFLAFSWLRHSHYWHPHPKTTREKAEAGELTARGTSPS